MPKNFKYGQANTVTDYSWNIDIEPWKISEELRKDYYSKKVKVESSYFKIYKKDIKPWFYMTDDLNYYKEKIPLKPDLTIPEVTFLSSEWDTYVKLSANKLLGAFLNDMPYKFLKRSKGLQKQIKVPSFAKDVKLAITYAPDFAVPLAEIDLLFSNKRNIKYAIERLAFAYYRAGETQKLKILLTQGINFKYPQPSWGRFRKYIIPASFGEKDPFEKYKDKFIPTHAYSIKKNFRTLKEFNNNISLKDERDLYLALIKNDTFKIRAYKKSIEKSKKREDKKEKSNKINKKDTLSILFEKQDNNLSFELQEKDVNELTEFFVNLNKRFDRIKLPVSKRYEELSNEELSAELAHTNRVLGNFSFFTVDLSLYILHERKISEYIIRPQELLYSIIQFYREYPQKYRSIAMTFWLQKTGMESKQEQKGTLYHDYFNAMEAIVYIQKFLKYDKSYFENEKNFFYLRKLMHNAIKLSHDPLSEKYFKSLWSHKQLVLTSFWGINAACKKRVESIQSAKTYLSLFSNYGTEYERDYCLFAEKYLRNAYFKSKSPNYELAKKMSLEKLKTTVKPESIADDLLVIAEKTDDTNLRDKAVKILLNSLEKAHQPVFVLDELLEVAKKRHVSDYAEKVLYTLCNPIRG